MAIRTRKKNGKLTKFIIISIICIIVLFAFLKVKPQTNQPNLDTTIPSPSEIRKYHSSILDLTIDIPNGYKLKEQLPEVLLIKNGDVITIHFVGTNKIYKTIDEFLDDKINTYNVPKNVEREKVFINEHDGEVVQVEYPQDSENNNKAYYFHINNGFYHIYTRSSGLYTDLDQIARSFRYEP